MDEQNVHDGIGGTNAVATQALTIPRKKRICLVGTACNNLALDHAARQFKVSVTSICKDKWETEKNREELEKYVEDTTYDTYFILEQFEGPEFDVLCKSAHRILGPTALLQLVEKKDPLPNIKRPLYTRAMVDTVVVFSGFRAKEDELRKLANMVLSMGGSIRKEMGIKVTHLIANHCIGEKYRYADTFGLPIMSVEWVTVLWKARDDISSRTNKSIERTYKLKPLYGAKVCFIGFPEEEKKHMCDILEKQGGEPTEIGDPNCTHVVIDESNINVLPNLGSASAYMVKTGWFWTSVQNEVAADEKDYLFEHYLETVMSPSASGRRDSQQIAGQSVGLPQHPLRLGVPLSDFLHSSYINGPDSPPSVSGSFLDCTASPDKQLMNEVEAGDIKKARGNLSKRHQVFRELVETESNYVGILNTIITLFKIPLENLIGMGEKELLNSTEVKTIFGNFLPIYNVHKQLLESLRYSDAHWTENISIGNIFLKFEKDLRKAYKPYLIFYKSTENELIKYDREKPRFHAFLKNCQTIPQCGRQTLKELLIKPVQRLPSIKLLFYEILKETDKSDPDFNALENSISCIEELLSDLNEAMKEAARQREVFFVYKYTENCPPDLVSSKRSFVAKCDVMELGWKESLSGRCDPLVLFLFTDTLVVCKKKSKAFNSLKSPNTMNDLQSSELSQEKFLYKYIKQLSLDTIRKVMDIRETDECHNAFALVVRSKQELKEKVFSFVITDEEVNKTNYLRTLCRQMAIPNKVADAGTLLISYDWHQFETGTSDNASGTFKKTIKSLFHNFYLEYMDPYVFLLNSMCETTLHVPLPFASRTRAKVSRAFSFNKTPSKLNRAMSTFMSPFGVAHDLAPTSQQRNQMRLGSCSNINELDNDGTSSPTRDDVIVAPMSDQPTRKALSMASLRRL